jgi:hypothetical protein
MFAFSIDVVVQSGVKPASESVGLSHVTEGISSRANGLLRLSGSPEHAVLLPDHPRWQFAVYDH